MANEPIGYHLSVNFAVTKRLTREEMEIIMRKVRDALPQEGGSNLNLTPYYGGDSK